MIFKIEDYPHKVERPKEELLMVRAPCLIPNTSLTASRIADAGKDEGSSCQIVNLRCKIFHQSTPIHPDPKNLNTERVIRCKIINSTQNNIVRNGKREDIYNDDCKHIRNRQLSEEYSFVEQEACCY